MAYKPSERGYLVLCALPRHQNFIMSLNPSTFETIVPSRYITFTFAKHLHVAVLDSPSAASAFTAAMWVPPGRESDWVFSTFSGHLQLLISSITTQPLSRLILVGKSPSYPLPTSYNSGSHPPSALLETKNLAPLLSALIPRSAFLDDGEIPEMPFLIYEDGVVRISVLGIYEGPCVGEMIVENVELERDGVREFRRRLRFKRMPNFVQSQMRIRPKNGSRLGNLDNVEFELDHEVLVQPYLSPMVAGISVISQFLEGRKRDGFRPKALCLGVGGGALLGLLSAQLDFEVVGVEEDKVVLEVAKRYFGLECGGSIRLYAEDGIKFVRKLAKNLSEECRFHVIMFDLDSSDASTGVCAPPVLFVRKSVLVALRDVLCEEGVLVINTIPSSELLYERLVREFHEVFVELYEIDVGNEENFVLVATKSCVDSALEADGCAFLEELKSVVSSSYLESIRKIPKTCDL